MGMEFLPEPPFHTGAFFSPAIVITIVSSYFLLWIMWISYLVPTIAKSRSECPKSLLFMENVEVLPGTDTGRTSRYR